MSRFTPAANGGKRLLAAVHPRIRAGSKRASDYAAMYVSSPAVRDPSRRCRRPAILAGTLLVALTTGACRADGVLKPDGSGGAATGDGGTTGGGGTGGAAIGGGGDRWSGMAGSGGTGGTATGGVGGGVSCIADGGAATFERGVYCVRPGLFVFGGQRFVSPGPSLSPCAADGTCPDGQACFRLTTELAFCDVPQQAPTDAVCSPACGAGQRCNQATETFYPCSPHTNYCTDTSCSSAGDCGAGTVCTPTSLILTGPSSGGVPGFTVWAGRCLPRSCASDQDCTSGSNGRCALVNSYDFAGCHSLLISSLSIACVYSGSPTDPGVCAGAWSCGDGCSHLCPTATGP